VIDDEVHEFDLVRGVALVVEELGERFLGGGEVEADEAADEDAEPAGFVGGSLDVSMEPDAGVEQYLLQRVEVGVGDGPVAVELLDGHVAAVLFEEVAGLATETLEPIGLGHEPGDRDLGRLAEGVGEVGVDGVAPGAVDELDEERWASTRSATSVTVTSASPRARSTAASDTAVGRPGAAPTCSTDGSPASSNLTGGCRLATEPVFGALAPASLSARSGTPFGTRALRADRRLFARSVCGLVRTTTVLSRCDRGADEKWRR
jgi:hypothetical protein